MSAPLVYPTNLLNDHAKIASLLPTSLRLAINGMSRPTYLEGKSKRVNVASGDVLPDGQCEACQEGRAPPKCDLPERREEEGVRAARHPDASESVSQHAGRDSGCPGAPTELFWHRTQPGRAMVVHSACDCWHCRWCFPRKVGKYREAVHQRLTQAATAGWSLALSPTPIPASSGDTTRKLMSREGARYAWVNFAEGGRCYACAVHPNRKLPSRFAPADLHSCLCAVDGWLSHLRRPQRLRDTKQYLVYLCRPWSLASMRKPKKSEWTRVGRLKTREPGPLVAALEGIGIASPRLVEGDEGWLLAFTSDAGPEAVTARLLAA